MKLRASNAGWIDRLPEHWGEARMRFTTTISPSSKEADHLSGTDEVSFLPMEAVGEDGAIDLSRRRPVTELASGYTYFRNGDVLVAKITPCFENGKVALADQLVGGCGFGSTEFHVLRPRKGLNAKFLLYVLRSAPFHDAGMASMYGAGGQKRVPTGFIEDFVIPLPPAYEQEAITSFLDCEAARIDALIAKQEAFLDRLAEHRCAVTTYAVTRGIHRNIALRDSGVPEVGEIASHWSVQKLRTRVSKIEQGWSPQCENRAAELGEWGVLKVGCVNGGRFNKDENKALPPDLEPRPHLEVHAGDLLLSRANTRELVGSAAVVDECTKLILCDKLYRIYPDTRNITPKFLAYCLNSEIGRKSMEASATGASPSMKNISQEVVKNLSFAYPDLEEQEQICTYLDQHARLLENVISISQDLMALHRERRTALITAAVTGQIDVSRPFLHEAAD